MHTHTYNERSGKAAAIANEWLLNYQCYRAMPSHPIRWVPLDQHMQTRPGATEDASEDGPLCPRRI